MLIFKLNTNRQTFNNYIASSEKSLIFTLYKSNTNSKKYYSDLRNKVNPFHVKELYLNEFKELRKKYFKIVSIYVQKSINGNSTIGEEKTFNNTTVFSGNYKSIIEQEVRPLYNIAIASDIEFKSLGYSIFDGEEISQTIFKVDIDKICHR